MRNSLKNTTIALTGLLISLNAYSQTGNGIQKQEIPASYQFNVKIGDTIPDFTLTLTNGQKVSSKGWRGKVVMLQFTASWCGVCRKEMPFIERDIWLKNKRNHNFLLFGVDRDEPLEKVKKFQKEIEITYPLALDPNADIFGIFADKKAGVTRNVIIDKKGKIVFLTRLFKESEFKEMVRVIEVLLK